MKNKSWKVQTNKALKLLLITILLILNACTGTQEIGVPRLVILATGGDSNTLTLTQDVFFSDRNESKRFQFLKDLTLPASPIAYDVIDRNAQRETLITISQNDTENADTFINLINLANINPDAPDNFDFINQQSINLSSLVNDTETRTFAPTRLQVSQDGRYIAFSNTFTTQNNAIDIIDLEATNGPELLERFTGRILSNTLVLDQNNTSNRLFFFSQEASGAVLNYFNLPNLTPISTNFTLPNSTTDLPLDMQLITDQLVTLQSNSFTPISNPTGTPTAGETITTLSNATQLTPTNANFISNVLNLSNNEFGAHRTITSELSSTSLSAINGSIEPSGGFAYYLANGSNPIRLFDLQTFNGNTETEAQNQLRSYPIYQSLDNNDTLNITDAAFITWAISKPPAALP